MKRICFVPFALTVPRVVLLPADFLPRLLCLKTMIQSTLGRISLPGSVPLLCHSLLSLSPLHLNAVAFSVLATFFLSVQWII
jgi:hypothetical protein